MSTLRERIELAIKKRDEDTKKWARDNLEKFANQAEEKILKSVNDYESPKVYLNIFESNNSFTRKRTEELIKLFKEELGIYAEISDLFRKDVNILVDLD